jgi:hypothetical protein
VAECRSIDGGDVIWGPEINYYIGLFSLVFVLV